MQSITGIGSWAAIESPENNEGEAMSANESDRELLELAAKAAGYNIMWNEHWHAFQHQEPQPDKHGHFRHAWVPLEDDGDALRLAVKLGITPHIDGNLTDAESTLGFCAEPYFDDSFAATRRAIVRAAAEIGRQQQNT